jgi:DNA repair photolyase
MIIREILTKNILTRSKIYEYTINPYGGCQHACAYCYARFTKRFSGHREAWGEYVDVKINAPDLLLREVARKKPGIVWISGVCDPYQPVEKKYQLTRKCLEILVRQDWPVAVQTRSPLVTRDIDLLKQSSKVRVTMSVTTADDSIRRIFEPFAPSIHARLKALAELHEAGIRTSAMIAPMLPGAEGLADMLAGKVDSVRIDRLNYHYADWVYKRHEFQDFMQPDYFSSTGRAICTALEKRGIECEMIC